MRLSATAFALTVLSPLAAFAQIPPAAPPPAAAPPVVETPAPVPPPPPVIVTPAPAPAPAPPPAKTWKDLVTFDGLVDAYYMYNTSGATSLSAPGGRQFDTNSNTFTLNYAKLGIGVSGDNVGLRIDMGYGSMGNIINGFTNVPNADPMMPGTSVPNAFLLQQAFVTLTPVENLTIDFGKFMTTAGAEVIEANKNWLYSRSILFFNIPLVHTGLRLGYKINDMVSLQVSAVNGWNGQGFEVDSNKDKTFGFSVPLTIPGGLSLIPTVYVGKEGASTDTRVLFDFVAAYSAGALGLNLNFDYVNDKAANIDTFIGIAAMAHYVVNDNFNVSARGEYAQFKVMSTTQKLEEFTLGVGFPMAGRFEFRPELRVDLSDPAGFPEAKKTQTTITGAFLAWF